MQTYEFHPIADLFPLLLGEDFSRLVADISEHGLHEPIWLYEGKIIDGRNRYRACLEAGVEAAFRTWEGEEGSLVAFVVSLNVHRRHLNESQRAMIAAKLATLERGDNQHTPIGGTSQAEAAELLHVGVKSIERAKTVYATGVPSLVEAVEQGKIAVSRAEFIAELSQEMQEGCVADAEKIRQLPGRSPGVLILQSTNNEWYTPSQYIESARRVLGAIDLDPASCPEANATVRATSYFTAEQDGLSRDWRGRIWLNPPWGGKQAEFVAKLLAEYEVGRVTASVLLVNAHCTDTTWFQPLWNHTLCFTDHRIDYRLPDGNMAASTSTHGSVFVYLGKAHAVFQQEFAQHGAVVRRYLP